MQLVIACDCGAHDTAEPGRPHVCRSCGRMWDVPELDGERATAIADVRRRHRTRLVGSAVAMLLGCGAVAAMGDPGALIFLLPAGLVLWAVVAVPSLRRSYRRALEGLGELELERHVLGVPEVPGTGEDVPEGPGTKEDIALQRS